MSDTPIETMIMKSADEISATEMRQEWMRYYSKKRMYEQFLQVQVLAGLDVQSVLEVGPYMGMVTSLLSNAGFDVTTLDITEPRFNSPKCPNILMDLTKVEVEKVKGFDVIMCGATLEHIFYEQAVDALKAFHAAKPKYVVMSVPYVEFHLFFEMYLSWHKFAQHFRWVKLRKFKTFVPDLENDPYGHKWEVGYKGYPLKRLEATFKEVGFKVVRRDFSYPSSAVFFILEPI